MQPEPLEQVVRNVDARLTRVEQILPTLATKEEMRTAIAEAIAPLATKEEVRAEVRDEGERTRRHFDVVAERLEGHIKLVAEGLIGLREHMDGRFDDVTADISRLDRRVKRLEADRLKQTGSTDT
jgi:glucan phosphorylase